MPFRECRAGIEKKKMSLSGSKTHPFWYADVGLEAKKEIVVEHINEDFWIGWRYCREAEDE